MDMDSENVAAILAAIFLVVVALLEPLVGFGLVLAVLLVVLARHVVRARLRG